MRKIPITFHKYDGRPCGKFAAMFMTELGIVVRSFAPLQVKGWKQISEAQKKPMFDRLQSAFTVDLGEGPNSLKKETEQLMKDCNLQEVVETNQRMMMQVFEKIAPDVLQSFMGKSSSSAPQPPPS